MLGSYEFWEKSEEYFINQLDNKKLSFFEISLGIFSFGNAKKGSDKLWNLFEQNFCFSLVNEKIDNFTLENCLNGFIEIFEKFSFENFKYAFENYFISNSDIISDENIILISFYLKYFINGNKADEINFVNIFFETLEKRINNRIEFKLLPKLMKGLIKSKIYPRNFSLSYLIFEENFEIFDDENLIDFFNNYINLADKEDKLIVFLTDFFFKRKDHLKFQNLIDYFFILGKLEFTNKEITDNLIKNLIKFPLNIDFEDLVKISWSAASCKLFQPILWKKIEEKAMKIKDEWKNYPDLLLVFENSFLIYGKASLRFWELINERKIILN